MIISHIYFSYEKPITNLYLFKINKVLHKIKLYITEFINLSLQIKVQATTGFQAFIVHYREDPDQQNLIDWIQEDWVNQNCYTINYLLVCY